MNQLASSYLGYLFLHLPHGRVNHFLHLNYLPLLSTQFRPHFSHFDPGLPCLIQPQLVRSQCLKPLVSIDRAPPYLGVPVNHSVELCVGLGAAVQATDQLVQLLHWLGQAYEARQPVELVPHVLLVLNQLYHLVLELHDLAS